ncbi:hypothetical protein DFJ77DRAFT_651 [Powellomyces hirtus]|nr:hypothetical protein DFJ77DRAFT_651 [Powellomyces hirtus]
MQSQALLSEAESLTDHYLTSISSLHQQIEKLESSQQKVLIRCGTPGLAQKLREQQLSRESHLEASQSGVFQPSHSGVFLPSHMTDKQLSQSSQSLDNGGGTITNTSRMSVMLDTSPASASPVQTPKSMFSKLPPEVSSANLPKPELMRLSVVYEMIETEADYVRDLELMINYHKPQLQETLSEEEINMLFSNTDQLVPVNQHLLDRLREKRDADPFIPEVGDAIVDVSESLKVYTTYCGNYPEAMKLVHKLQTNPDTKDQLTRMMNSTEGRGLSLESFLIKPVQRICKYPLLIRELQKHTDKLSKDTISLNLAMTKIESVVAHVNEYTRQLGERDRLVALQAKIDTPLPLALHEKKHVRDGVLARVINGKARERYVLLFADVLFICTPLKGGRYVLESVHDVAELTLVADGKGDPISKSLKHAFQISEGGRSQAFCAISDPDRTKWIEAFQSAIKTAAEEAKKSEHVNKRASSGAFLVQQFHSAQDGSPEYGGSPGDRHSLRPTSWAMGKRPMTKQGSNLSVGGTLRGTIKGWGTLRRKELDFANETQESSGNTSFSELEPEVEFEPEMVEIAGQIWKKAISAMGTSYYYCAETKETLWRLPDAYTVLDPETGKVLIPEDVEGGAGDSDDDGGSGDDADSTAATDALLSPSVESVEGSPSWRRVDRRDGNIYFFNVVTNETSWTKPEGDAVVGGNAGAGSSSSTQPVVDVAA